MFADSSSDSSSESEDDLDLLLVEWLFPLTKRHNTTRLNLEDIEDFECERLFRYVFSVYAVKLQNILLPLIRFQMELTCRLSYCVCRFQKKDMDRLARALQIPAIYICSRGTIATRMEALMILLRRLAYPNRWCDLEAMFGRSESELTLIFNKV